MTRPRRVCVLGLGHIGLPTAAAFAGGGAAVLGVDVSRAVVDSVNAGRPHIREPDLDALLRRVVREGGLRAAPNPEPADAFIIAVPTPFREDRQPDLRCIEDAARAIAPHLARGSLVVLESTVPVGTSERLSAWLAAHRPDLGFPHQAGEASDIRIAHCPERVLPGRILAELAGNARIIGGLTPRCAQAAAALYRIVARGEIHLTDARTAEMAKLAENAYRDVNIAFANELSILCDGLGVDVRELIRLANRHPRVDILQPGPGVGGHCIAVDPWFLVAADPARARLIRTAREVNDAKPGFVVETVRAQAARLRDPVIACLGLTYKADVDDLRESPALAVVAALARAGIGEILVVDPHVEALPAALQGLGVRLADLDGAMARAGIVVLLVDHAAFRAMGREAARDRIVVDTRGVW